MKLTAGSRSRQKTWRSIVNEQVVQLCTNPNLLTSEIDIDHDDITWIAVVDVHFRLKM